MNLIEQLGGYEEAKKALIDAQNSNDIDPIIYINDQEVLTDCVCDALIQYRRENNIFENGDKIIFSAMGNSVMDFDECLRMFLSQGLVRHATDKEQGYRDD